MLLNRQLLEVATGRRTRLLVTMPPRHGKSMLISHFFPAWYLGIYPERRVMLASYANEFSASWGRKARDVMLEWGNTLYGLNVHPQASAAHHWQIEDHEGGMISVGAGGSLTGQGADLLIIDDPVKNAEQATSKTWQDKTWDWFHSTALTRLEPSGSVVLVQTRWSERDLAGKLLAQDERGDQSWKVFNLPALAEPDDPLNREPGEALWPERFPVAKLESIRNMLGARWWSALYQQRPVTLGGQIFRREWFRYWKPSGNNYRLEQESVPKEDCWRFATVDLAIALHARADYTAALVWACTPMGDLVLLDCIRDRFSAPALLNMLRKLFRRWELDFLGIEKAGFQESIIQQLRKEGLPVKSLTPKGTKEGRAAAAAVRFEGGQVYFPTGLPWLVDLESELLAFPSAEHDDMVDAVSYACQEVSRRYGVKGTDQHFSDHEREQRSSS